nr:histidine kinase [Nostoc sp. CreGUA01]
MGEAGSRRSEMREMREQGRQGENNQCLMPNAPCPMPDN